jgi:hypothetical protein
MLLQSRKSKDGISNQAMLYRGVIPKLCNGQYLPEKIKV